MQTADVPSCQKGACGSINPTNSAHGTTRFISSRNSRLRVLLVINSKPVVAKLFLFHRQLTSVQARRLTYADGMDVSTYPKLMHR